MALQVKGIKREFIIERDGKDITLTDPNNQMTPEGVMKFYMNNYPELTNASVVGPKVKGEVATYEFKTTVGTKG